MRLLCLKTFPSLLVENEVWTASSPDVWGRPTERRGGKQKQEGGGGSDDLRQRPIRSTDVWSSVRRVRPRETQPGLIRPAGSRCRGSVSTGRDAEFFPLGSRRDSSASHCSTKTHEEETKTINDHQRTNSDRRFNTVRSRSGEAGQRSTSGGHDHFHTQRRSSQSKYPRWKLHVTTNTWLQLLLLLLHSS